MGGSVPGLTPRRETSRRLVRRHLASCDFGLSLALQQRALRDSGLLADSAGKCRGRCLRSSILRNWPSGGELHCASGAGAFASLASLSRGAHGETRPSIELRLCTERDGCSAVLFVARLLRFVCRPGAWRLAHVRVRVRSAEVILRTFE